MMLVAAHGAGDSPEWQCRIWNEIVRGRGFILCPRGRGLAPGPDPGAFFFPNHHFLEKNVLAALAELKSRFGARIAPGPVVYTGYSQGAIMGALFTARRGETFSRLALIEGGFREWDVPTARAFRRSGGARVLFACGGEYCARLARSSVGWLEKAGVEARLEYAPHGGHTYDGEVGARVSAAFDWLVDGDARWTAR